MSSGQDPARPGGYDAQVDTVVNGVPRADRLPANLLLVEYLRETLGLRGTHIGCDTSSCGACTVLVNGMAVKSCTLLAVQADGCSIETVESLRRADGSLHELQAAFVEHAGLQCGFCTPGMLMAGVSLLREMEEPTESRVRHGIEGNLCRCTGYEGIVDAILSVAEASRSGAQVRGGGKIG